MTAGIRRSRRSRKKDCRTGVIQAQVGHVAPEKMKTYSHIRQHALNEAAAALEPSTPTNRAPQESTPRTEAPAKAGYVTTHVTKRVARGRLLDFPRVLPET